MQILFCTLCPVYFRWQLKWPINGAEGETEHIECCQKCRNNSNYPKGNVQGSCKFAEPGIKSVGQYFILRKETGQRRYTRNGNSSNQKSFIGRRHVFFQPTHVSHVLGIKMHIRAFLMQPVFNMLHRMNHRSGTKEEASLEKSVCYYMKDGGRKG